MFKSYFMTLGTFGINFSNLKNKKVKIISGSNILIAVAEKTYRKKKVFYHLHPFRKLGKIFIKHVEIYLYRALQFTL